MKFLLDENVPNSFKEFLIQHGYPNIIRINDIKKGIPDEEVYNISMREKRVLITADTDFFVYKEKQNFGIIFLRGKLSDRKEKLIKVLRQIEQDERIVKPLENIFIRITNQNFVIKCKHKNKYKEIKCKYK